MAAGLVYGVATQQRHALVGALGLRVFLFLVLGVYFVWFWSRSGQTLAMQTWHIRLVTREGRPVTRLRALLPLLAGLAVVRAGTGGARAGGPARRAAGFRRHRGRRARLRRAGVAAPRSAILARCGLRHPARDLDPAPSTRHTPLSTRTFSVCVYCGSRHGARPAYTAAARALGQAIGSTRLATGLRRRPGRPDGRGGRRHTGCRRPRHRRHPGEPDEARGRPPRPARAARGATPCTSASR